MFTKLFLVCVLAIVAFCQEYPAGVNTALCPNYPYCNTRLFTRFTIDGEPTPEWFYNPRILPVPPINPALVAGPRYPVAFPPAPCPNYPYCY